MKRLVTMVAVVCMLVSILGSSGGVSAQKGEVESGTASADRSPIQLVRAYHRDNGAAPAWAQRAAATAIDAQVAHGRDRADFVLRSVEEDTLATHVRLDQQYAGLPVFGGQVVVHLDGTKVVEEGGDFYAVGKLDTAPSISADAATATAVGDLKYDGQVEQTTRLLVLAYGQETPLLAYQVSLHIEDGTDATAHHEYFINAHDGSTVFYYNDLDVVNANGTGKSLYSGQVSIVTDYTSNKYYLRDNSRGGMDTIDMRNGTSGGYYFTDGNNIWGNHSTNNAKSAAIDAQYGAAKTWDYFLNTFNRRGIDGNGFKVRSRVHYGSKYNNAFWNGSYMTYGDGDGSTFGPLVSIDIAGHEIAHGLTSKTAGLIYSYESGALNESFSDIFGTMVEYYSYGSSANYLIGEDAYTPGTAGDALRSMENPALGNDPDHYSIRYTGSGDNGGVHINSGIPNQAFYLLAQGGTNRTSGLSVSGIGRAKASAIFYRALTVYLSSSSNFKAARTATLNSARDLYGSGSVEYNAVVSAWNAVGVTN